MDIDLPVLMLVLKENAEDFSAVLHIEPSNATAQEEMQRVTILIHQENAKVRLNNCVPQSSHYVLELKKSWIVRTLSDDTKACAY